MKYREHNKPRYQPAAASIPLPNVTMPSPDSPLVLPGQPNPENKPGLIPLFQYISNIYQQYLQGNVNVGYLKVSVTSAGGAIPLAGAKITISKPLGENVFLSQVVYTDSAGQTPEVALPTRSVEVSQTAEYPVPYTIWNLTAEAEGFNEAVVYDISVFPGIVTTQSFDMTPIEIGAVPRVDEIYATAKRMNHFDRFRR